MPIYEYLCEACGHGLEVIQKLSDPLLTDCPACSRPQLKKRISAAGFQLKGSGWYATDFKNSGKTKDAKTETKSDSASDTKAGGCGSGGCGCH